MTNDRLEWQLENWALYMKRPSSKLGYPSKSMCISSGGVSGVDEFELMCEESDTQCAITMDSIIDSISQPCRVAINHHWLGVAHHYPTQLLDYDIALGQILKLARKRGLE